VKRFITGALALITGITMAFNPATAFATSEPPIPVYIHGERVIFLDQQPTIIDGNTLVGVRGVFDTLGFELEWDGGNATTPATVTMTRMGFETLDEGLRRPMQETIIITIGSRHLEVNGVTKQYALTIPAQLIGGRTMLPLRAPLEAVGYELEWIGTTRTILITDPNHTTLEQLREQIREQALERNLQNQEEMERRVFELVNEERANEGLPPLIWHDATATAARLHAQDLFDNNRGLFDMSQVENPVPGYIAGHLGTDGSTPTVRLQRQFIITTGRTAPPVRPDGVTFIVGSGENAGGAAGARITPEYAVNAWMNSPGHRAAIMGQSVFMAGSGFVDFTHTGVGYVNGFWVQKFIAVH